MRRTEDEADFAPFDPTPLDLPSIPDILMAHRRGANARELAVVFSPSGRFALMRTDFGRDALHLVDKTGLYYVTRLREIVAALIDLMERGGYERTLLMGTSKGAFGALAVAREAARTRRDMTFRALAFSPQVKLYPGNRALYFPSYSRLRSIAGRSPSLGWTLRRLGDVSDVGDEPNVFATIVFGEGNETDRGEASRMRGPNVAMRPLGASAHSLLVYLKLRDRSADDVRSRIARLYTRAREKGQEEDRDLFASRPADPEQMVREIVEPATPLPTLDQLIDEAMAADPRPLDAGERLAAWRWRARRFGSLIVAELHGWPRPIGKTDGAPDADDPD